MKLPGLEHNAAADDYLANEEHNLVAPAQEGDFNEATALASASPETTALTDQQALDDTPGPTQEDALIFPDETWEPFLATPPPHSVSLPHDVILIILGFLSSNNLNRTFLLNRTAHWLSRIVLIKRYESLLKDSRLWEYLPTIAQDLPETGGKAFIDYVERACGYQFRPQNRSHFRTLSSTLTHLNNHRQIPSSWNGSACNEFAQLQTLAQIILAAYPQDLAKPPTAVKAFIQCCSPENSTAQQLKLWHNYFRLDAQLSTLMLFLRLQIIQTRNRQQRNNPHDQIGDLINPDYSRHLRGCGLIALNTVIPGIFERLVREALRLFKKENKNKAEEERLKLIEALLDRLTEADLLQYIPPEYDCLKDPPDDPTAIKENLRGLDPQRALMIEVIDANYLFLMRKFSCAVLIRIERYNWRKSLPHRELRLSDSRVIHQILNSVMLLDNLGENGLIHFLSFLMNPDVAINNYPSLWPFLTYELIEKWFLTDEAMPKLYASVIITHPELLKKLTNTQIVSIAIHLGVKSIQAIFDSSTFRARLIEDKESNTEHKNCLLMQLAESSNEWLSYSIAEHPFTASLLTHDELFHLMYSPKFRSSHQSIRRLLLHKDTVVLRLSSNELCKVALQSTALVIKHVGTHHLGRFNNQDLIIFSKDCVNSYRKGEKEDYQFIFDLLPTELAKRSNTLTSAQWLEFASMHPEIGVLIANQYLEKLNDSDVIKLANHYKANKSIGQKVSTLLWSREREKLRQQAEAFAEKERLTKEKQDQQAQALAEKERLRNVAFLSERRRLECERAERAKHAADHLRIIESTVKPTEEKALWPWKRMLRFVLFTLLGILGFSLLVLGIGTAIGIPLAAAITTTLFSFLPWSTALTSCIIGFVTHLISGVFLGTTPENNHELPSSTKTIKSSYSSFFGSLDCRPDSSDSKIKSHKVSLPQVRDPHSKSNTGFVPHPSEKPSDPESTFSNPFSPY